MINIFEFPINEIAEEELKAHLELISKYTTTLIPTETYSKSTMDGCDVSIVISKPTECSKEEVLNPDKYKESFKNTSKVLLKKLNYIWADRAKKNQDQKKIEILKGFIECVDKEEWDVLEHLIYKDK